MSSSVAALPAVAVSPRRDRRDSLPARFALAAEVVRGGFLELWAHKLRSVLTLTLLMLGVFTLVVLTSVIDGVVDKVQTGFSGLAWDGTAILQAREPKTTDDQKRFAMSPGLRFDDLPRLTAPHPKVAAFLPAPRSGLPCASREVPNEPSSAASRPTTPSS